MYCKCLNNDNFKRSSGGSADSVNNDYNDALI